MANYQIGTGNLNDVLTVGRTGESVQFGGTTSATMGWYGATPVVQPSSSSQAATTSTAAASISATQWGFSTSTQADAIVTLVNRLRADLVTLGIIKGSA